MKTNNAQDSENARANNVSAENQVPPDKYVQIQMNGGSKKVLFVGNSITHHIPNKDIGWFGNFGMAASCEENDYVHIVLNHLRNVYGEVDYAIVQAAYWERHYEKTENLLPELYSDAKDFGADIVIIRLGENVFNETLEAFDFKPYFKKMIDFFGGDKCEKLLITDMFWHRTFNDVFRQEATERKCPFVHLTDLENEEGSMAIGLFEHQGVSRHPSDYGMKRIAERIIEKL